MASTNVELLSEVIRALNARDTDALRRLFHRDGQWRPAVTAGGALERSVYEGPDGAAKYLQDLDEFFVDTHIETISIESITPDHVLFEGRVTARGRESGVPLDARLLSVWEFRDGKLYRGTPYLSRAEALKALE